MAEYREISDAEKRDILYRSVKKTKIKNPEEEISRKYFLELKSRKQEELSHLIYCIQKLLDMRSSIVEEIEKINNELDLINNTEYYEF